MTKVVRCPACGEETTTLVCRSCGSALPDDVLAGMQAQGWSDRDQTASDQDQTWSDHDQTASDRDQRSADDDQLAADKDFAAGGDASVHHRSVRARERSARDRHLLSTMRDETAAARAQTAVDRDRAAALRDRGAEGRDELARLHDLDDDTGASYEDVVLRAQRDRYRAAADRAKAADDRKRAADDRAAAARERAAALHSSTEAMDALTVAATDELTGAWTRRFGLAQVARELERAHRVGASLVVAFVDVDGLKEVNDRRGHMAGDALLRLVGKALRANVRAYDVLVRYGGDELLCAMPNVTTAEATSRFESIAAALTAVGTGHSVTFGLAEAQAGDSLEDLIGRADNALIAARSSQN
jgi:diguanylate cyclase (GGDEF)-like protein